MPEVSSCWKFIVLPTSILLYSKDTIIPLREQPNFVMDSDSKIGFASVNYLTTVPWSTLALVRGVRDTVV